MTGYLNNWEGSVIIDSHDIKEKIQIVKTKIGYLPENNPLYQEMYVKEYLEFVSKLYTVRDPKINKLLEEVGLTDHFNKKIGSLSKGHKLIHEPKYIILDEPTSGIDPNQMILIRKLIKDLGKTRTVFLSSHVISEIELLCDRVVIMNKGKVILDRKIEELIPFDQKRFENP